MAAPDRGSISLVLSGAITRGGFEAGVLKVLSERRIRVRRIAATSSGSLTGVAYAAAVRARREAAVADEIVTVWSEQADFRHTLHFNLRGAIHGDGLSDQKRLLALLRRRVQPNTTPDPAPIDLHIVVAPLYGVPRSIGDERMAAYTEVLSFHGGHFDRRDSLDRIFEAAAASAAFPGLFMPVEVPGIGPCIDGGLVSSTPIQHVFGDDAEEPTAAIVAVASAPSFLRRRRRWWRGWHLSSVIDMVFNEQIYRALRDDAETKAQRSALEDLARRKGWTPEQLEEAEAALGWPRGRMPPIVSIRPLASLPGGPLSGLYRASDRRRHIEIGIERANRVLDAIGWT